MDTVIELRNIRKTYRMGDVEVHALNGISLKIYRGEFVSVMGSSGSGKSTLMNILGCLDRATEGDYLFEGVNVNSLSGNDFARIRNRKIGFVFQVFNLLPRTTALENVELPLLYNREQNIKNPEKRAAGALERVGLDDRMSHEPSRLSGGQQQRVAIARALINNPSVILADEPTGNLDSRTSEEIMSLFRELNDSGITVILVTHESDIASWAGRTVTMRDGLVVTDTGSGRTRKTDTPLPVPEERGAAT